MKRKVFPDGSYVEWANKECVNYVEPDRWVQVWVDHEPGLFSRGRIIRLSSINKWTTNNDGFQIEIDQETKKSIVDKIIKYFEGIKVSIEE